MRPGGGGQVAAVDGGAARGVGYHQAVAQQLGQSLDVGCLTAAGAGTAEFEERAHELLVLHLAGIQLGAVSIRQLLEEVPVVGLGFQCLGCRSHGQGVGGAYAGAERAARAVCGRYLDDELLALPVLVHLAGIGALEGFRGAFQLGGVYHLGAQSSMRAHGGALAALDTGFAGFGLLGLPDRNFQRQVALFILGGAAGEGAVHRHFGNLHAVAFANDNLAEHVAHKVGGTGGQGGGQLVAGDGGAQGHFVQVGQGGIHSLDVLGHHFVTLLAVGLLDGFLNVADGFIGRNHTGEVEEAGLHDHVDAAAHARGLGHLEGINAVHLDVLVDNLLLHAGGQAVPHLVSGHRGVDEEGGAGGGVLQEVEGVEQAGLVQGDEVRAGDEVGAVNRRGAEAQVRYRGGTGLLGVVHEVALHVEVGVLADNLDGVLVGTHGTVGTQTIEHAAGHGVGFGGEAGVIGDGETGHVVLDTHGKAGHGSILLQFIEYALHHGGGEFLGTQTIATTHDNGHGKGQGALHGGVGKGLHHILQQGFAQAAGFLGAVEHSNLLHGLGQGGNHVLCRERTVQTHLEHADVFAECLHGFKAGFGAGAHDDDDAGSLRAADVFHHIVAAAGELAEFLHGLLHNAGNGVVELVDGFATLEVDVRVLGGAADDRGIRGEGAGVESVDQVLVNHAAQLLVGDVGNLAHFVRGAEAVEEVDEGHAAFQRGGVGNGGHIRGFLGGGAAKHGKTRGAGAHHVAVVTENGKTLGGKGAGCNVEDAGSQFTSNL